VEVKYFPANLSAPSTVAVRRCTKDVLSYRHHRSDIDIIGVGRKTLPADCYVIGIEGNVGDGEFAAAVGGNSP
jgi:hypothetical protein